MWWSIQDYSTLTGLLTTPAELCSGFHITNVCLGLTRLRLIHHQIAFDFQGFQVLARMYRDTQTSYHF